jgi:tetratricopeptide (TPR) repeat protein
MSDDNLAPIKRSLFLSLWLKGVLVLFLLLFIGVPLSIFKVWKSTPDGFSPAIKISLFDQFRAWSLYRFAMEAKGDGRDESALRAWREAIVNHPGDIEGRRGYLELLVDLDQKGRHERAAVQNAFWLLRLGQTNVVDLELVASTFEHYQLEGLSLQLLSNNHSSPTLSLERAKLRALFLGGEISEFAQRWVRVGSEFAADPEMQLFDAAYLAGWGSPAEASINLPLLGEAMRNPVTDELAHRLNLLVSYTRLDVEEYEVSLTFLMNRNLDRPPNHVRYWNLLTGLGRGAEAIEAATSFPSHPRSAVEATQFAEAYVRMGLRDVAFRILQRYSTDYSAYDTDWSHQAERLIYEESWDELAVFAIRLRISEHARRSLVAYGFFLEGMAEMHRQGSFLARTAFRNLSRYSLVESRVGLFVASNLLEWGFVEEARDVLIDVKGLYRDKWVFWELLLETGNQIGSSRDILLASENIYRLRPNDLTAKNRLAALLLSLRIRSEEVIALTYQVMDQDAGNASGMINHARALLRVDSIDEAALLLESLNEKPLNEPLKQRYYLAWLEIEFQRGRMDEAKTYSEKIDVEFLLLGDRDWFREIRREIETIDSSPESSTKPEEPNQF